VTLPGIDPGTIRLIAQHLKFYTSLQLIGYACDINMRRRKRAVREVYKELKERANEVERAQHQNLINKSNGTE
jgi:hypothetical protein